MIAIKSKSKSGLLAGAVCCALLSAAAATAAEESKSEPSRAEQQQKLEAAQKRLDAAAREVADLSMSMSDDVMPHVMRFHGPHPQRAVLGMVIGTAPNTRRDDGVAVLSVSPGGGAAEAGLKAGDVLTEINGKPLKTAGDESPDSQLRAAMREIDPGQKVTLKYLRDGKTATATVVAREPADRMFNVRVPGPPGAPHGLPNFAFMRAEGVFGSAELVPLTPKLGQYFGSEKGLLVVRAPADARLRLEEGDVIVDIDGRVPSSPAHAMQILGSYQAGEMLKLNVLRMKKRINFDITIPEDVAEGQHGMRRSGLHHGFMTAPLHMPPIDALPAVRTGIRLPPPADGPI